jgi:tetratricopeptide (TPR) repeat protein
MNIKPGHRGCLNGLIIAFTISLCLLAIGMFAGQCLLYSGIEHVKKGEYLRAGADFIMATRISPLEPKAAYFAAGSLLLCKDYQGALRYYDQVRRAAPEYLDTRRYRLEAMNGGKK